MRNRRQFGSIVKLKKFKKKPSIVRRENVISPLLSSSPTSCSASALLSYPQRLSPAASLLLLLADGLLLLTDGLRHRLPSHVFPPRADGLLLLLADCSRRRSLVTVSLRHCSTAELAHGRRRRTRHRIMVAFKNRYLVMEVHLDPNRDMAREDPILLSYFNVSKAIKDSILSSFGECGLGAALGSLQVKYVNSITKVCIIRVSREDYQKVWSAITMVTSIGNCPVLFNLLDLSGSLRACKNAALKYDQAKFEHLKNLVGDRLSSKDIQECNNCFEKIKILEH